LLHDVHYGWLKCSKDDPQTSEGLVLLGDGMPSRLPPRLPPNPLLRVPVHAGLVGELAQYALFYQSYQPSIQKVPN
jgi:hypothetical protein